MKKKIVYVGMAADILHEGHINILKIANSYGDVIVGLLTDEAISSYKNPPYLNYRRRKIILDNNIYVKKVIPQKTLDYVKNLNLFKPDYLVHGDDWKKGVQKKTRSRAIKVLKKWSGKLIEPKYTLNISSSLIKKKFFNERNYIYVLSNKSYKGIYKIGCSSYFPSKEAQVLNNSTAIIHPFKVVFFKKFQNAENIKKKIYNKFKLHRIKNNKDFFKIDLIQIKKYIKSIA